MINPDSITLEQFMVHDNITINFKDGINLITGVNGSGKSAIIEAIATGFWGMSLRKKWSPWRKEPGLVKIKQNDMVIIRQWDGQRKILYWEKDGKSVNYENTTKNQESLCSIIGSFDIWKKTSVFSSSDASLFTMATDAERKRLLESILQLSWFEDASKKCKNELKDCNAKLNQCYTNNESLMQNLQSLYELQENAEKLLNNFTNSQKIKEIKDKLKNSKQQYDSIIIEEKEIKNRHQQTLNKINELKLKIKSINDQIDKIPKNKCYTCKQPISKEYYEYLLNEQKITVDELIRILATQKRLFKKIDNKYQIINNDSNSLFHLLSNMNSELKILSSISSQLTQAKKSLEGIEDRIHLQKEQLLDNEEIIDKLEINKTELEICDRVLGINGVRSQIIVNTLFGIESVTNSWLKKFSNNIQIGLKCYKEKKTGGISDSISLLVYGAGGGYDYSGASAGERRRIDTAILFGLSEIANAANPNNKNMLFFDEVFDSLDDEGIEQIISSLHELSKDKNLVIISHKHIDILEEVCSNHIHFGA